MSPEGSFLVCRGVRMVAIEFMSGKTSKDDPMQLFN